jgi:hypothetical protein
VLSFRIEVGTKCSRVNEDLLIITVIFIFTEEGREEPGEVTQREQ